MTATPTGQLVGAARSAGAAVLAFNAITLEHAEAIIDGAERAERPVIVQISENAVRYHGGRLAPLAASCRALADASRGDVALHLDHVEDPLLLRQAADCGMHSVMIDASRMAYSANIAATAAAVEWAHERGIWIEAELGEVGGKDGAHAPGVRTDPADAVAFVAATGVDALAVAVGSSHAMTERTATLDLALIAELRDRLDVPLVLHGSSGVSNDELRQAIASGMVKINIGTLLNLSFTARVRAELAASTEVVDPRRYLGPARQAMADVVAAALTDLVSRPA